MLGRVETVFGQCNTMAREGATLNCSKFDANGNKFAEGTIKISKIQSTQFEGVIVRNHTIPTSQPMNLQG